MLKFTLRIPPELKEWLDQHARQHLQSSSAQILSLIKAAQMQEEGQNAGAGR